MDRAASNDNSGASTLGAHSASALRGDYAGADADFAVSQDWAAYTADDHETWRMLYRAQSAVLPDRACRGFLDGLERLDCAEGIPDFEVLGGRLRRATGWDIVAVPGFIPDATFFGHLAARRFPVTRWIRQRDEMDYLVEPDVFHDWFGHVPLILDPVFADFLQAYGQAGLKADAAGSLAQLARLYWHTVEFGLIREDGALRAYGAGILSSRGETVHCLESAEPARIAFERERVMRTLYRIDSFQPAYFVIDSFEQLFAAIASPGFAAAGPDIEPGVVLAADRPVSISQDAA
jgi:phenylalanine-4-hydroxylase